MKILYLGQFFNPEPSFKGLSFMGELAKRGHEVEVLTGFPNFPGGKVYAGYKVRAFQREMLGGLRVNRVALYPSHSTSAIGRVLNYGSFALSASVLGPFVTRKPDVVYVYSPPATVGMPAAILSALRGVPFVYDVQDLWPDTVATTGMLSNRRILAGIGRWCSFVYRRAAHIAVLSPGFKRALTGRGVPERKITVIPNWCNESSGGLPGFDENLAQSQGLGGRFNILFAGTLGKGQDLDAVLAAAEVCALRNPRIQFVFVGDGVERARLEAKAKGRANVRFLPYRPPSEMPALLALADVLLVHLKADPLFAITIPSKTQSYLEAGKPILMAVAGDAADIVSAAGAGMLTPPGDPERLAAAALAMAELDPAVLRAMGEAGRTYYYRELSLERGTTRFEEVFTSVVGSAGRTE
jgi:colanic acid biosynthesis glycosyl transferase WcaI